MKLFFALPACLALVVLLSSCSKITVLRTKEIKEASELYAASTNRRMDSLVLIIDSLKFEQDRNFSRLKAEFMELNSKIVAYGNSSEARLEEINFRMDRILGIVQQKSVVTKSAAGSAQNAEQERKNREMEGLYNASRTDYHKGEYAVAYNGFKQIYETLKTGELAENSLYWMGMCMLDAGKKENAQILFKTLLEKYPQSKMVCAVNFKLASMAEDAKNTAEQKAYLQKLLGTEICAASNEFQRAAEILSNH
jgi:TolA-binding protein